MAKPEPLSTHLESLKFLYELANDLRSCWDRTTDDIWRRIDPDLWDATRNPRAVLQAASEKTLRRLASDTEFRQRAGNLLLALREYETTPAWYQRTHRGAPLKTTAYFSMEFGLSEALPIYSGGLGNVAGDQLKAGSDLGVSIIGVGLMYQQGYFRQAIDADGNQTALYPYNDPALLPVTPVRDRDGELIRIVLDFAGRPLRIRAWQAKVGRLTLYLLDTNDPANLPVDRGITSELYGGGPELRLMQEVVLGIGGWRLLRKLALQADVCHLNEGHAAFAVLERARDYMEQTGHDFEVALTVTRAGNLFTTHTPVAAGFDRFAAPLMRAYFERYAAERLRIEYRDLLALGRLEPDNASEPFNMAYLAVRGAGAVNGVSRLHGEVSRAIFQPLFPRWPHTEVPVGHVTNGVHMASWASVYAERLWSQTTGGEQWLGMTEATVDELRKVSDELLWGLRARSRTDLVNYTRDLHRQQLAAAGEPREEVGRASELFNPDVLTLGFARRFATYKRPNLLLSDPARLTRLLTNPGRPVQLVIAGKAHPQDEAGKAMVRAWVQFVKRPEVKRHVVFLADYDMMLAAHLVQGVDVWINNPRRPWEASGTSGMKVLVNGGLNLSELDGWWAEAYTPEVGWAIGDGKEHGDDAHWDAVEAEELYTRLEREVVPAFYERDAKGIPRGWIKMMRASMTNLAPQFSATRTVRDYTEKYYLPAAAAYHQRDANTAAVGVDLVNWRLRLAQGWSGVHFGKFEFDAVDGQHRARLRVYLGGLDQKDVRVELWAEGRGGDPPARLEMAAAGEVGNSRAPYLYTALIPGDRPPEDFTPRVIPYHPDAILPLEANEIIWFK